MLALIHSAHMSSVATASSVEEEVGTCVGGHGPYVCVTHAGCIDSKVVYASFKHLSRGLVHVDCMYYT